jgi:RND superfamily putative drug exporter
MVIGPALLCLAGDWNWWPWGLRLPRATPSAGSIAPSERGPAE